MFKVMYSGSAFSITVRSWDRATENGGNHLTYRNCFLHFTGAASQPIAAERPPLHHVPTGSKKSPHHKLNGTLNVLLKNGEIRTLHLPLIEFFNDKKVIP